MGKPWIMSSCRHRRGTRQHGPCVQAMPPPKAASHNPGGNGHDTRCMHGSVQFAPELGRKMQRVLHLVYNRHGTTKHSRTNLPVPAFWCPHTQGLGCECNSATSTLSRATASTIQYMPDGVATHTSSQNIYPAQHNPVQKEHVQIGPSRAWVKGTCCRKLSWCRRLQAVQSLGAVQ